MRVGWGGGHLEHRVQLRARNFQAVRVCESCHVSGARQELAATCLVPRASARSSQGRKHWIAASLNRRPGCRAVLCRSCSIRGATETLLTAGNATLKHGSLLHVGHALQLPAVICDLGCAPESATKRVRHEPGLQGRPQPRATENRRLFGNEGSAESASRRRFSASQRALHTATLAAQWWAERCLLPPSWSVWCGCARSPGASARRRVCVCDRVCCSVRVSIPRL